MWPGFLCRDARLSFLTVVGKLSCTAFFDPVSGTPLAMGGDSGPLPWKHWDEFQRVWSLLRKARRTGVRYRRSARPLLATRLALVRFVSLSALSSRRRFRPPTQLVAAWVSVSAWVFKAWEHPFPEREGNTLRGWLCFKRERAVGAAFLIHCECTRDA